MRNSNTTSDNRVVTPAQFLRTRAPFSGTVVACVGDSITLGSMGSNWVVALAKKFPALQFVNAGRNSDLAWNVAQRLDVVIATQPALVTILLGSNDVEATFSPAAKRAYRRNRRLPQAPTLEWYVATMDSILARLTKETDAQLVILDLPPLGEDLTSTLNATVDLYNAELRKLASRHNLSVLPLHDSLIGLRSVMLPTRPYETWPWATITAALQKVVLRRSWNRIGSDRGLAITVDNVHLNDRAGAVLAGLVAPLVAEL